MTVETEGERKSKTKGRDTRDCAGRNCAARCMKWLLIENLTEKARQLQRQSVCVERKREEESEREREVEVKRDERKRKRKKKRGRELLGESIEILAT